MAAVAVTDAKIDTDPDNENQLTFELNDTQRSDAYGVLYDYVPVSTGMLAFRQRWAEAHTNLRAIRSDEALRRIEDKAVLYLRDRCPEGRVHGITKRDLVLYAMQMVIIHKERGFSLHDLEVEMMRPAIAMSDRAEQLYAADPHVNPFDAINAYGMFVREGPGGAFEEYRNGPFVEDMDVRRILTAIAEAGVPVQLTVSICGELQTLFWARIEAVGLNSMLVTYEGRRVKLRRPLFTHIYHGFINEGERISFDDMRPVNTSVCRTFEARLASSAGPMRMATHRVITLGDENNADNPPRRPPVAYDTVAAEHQHPWEKNYLTFDPSPGDKDDVMHALQSFIPVSQTETPALYQEWSSRFSVPRTSERMEQLCDDAMRYVMGRANAYEYIGGVDSTILQCAMRMMIMGEERGFSLRDMEDMLVHPIVKKWPKARTFADENPDFNPFQLIKHVGDVARLSMNDPDFLAMDRSRATVAAVDEKVELEFRWENVTTMTHGTFRTSPVSVDFDRCQVVFRGRVVELVDGSWTSGSVGVHLDWNQSAHNQVMLRALEPLLVGAPVRLHTDSHMDMEQDENVMD